MEWVLWWGPLIALAVVLLAPRRQAADEKVDDQERDGESDGRSASPLLAHGIAVYAHEDEPRATIEPGRCRACGTTNDPSYTYCRACLTPLR